MGGRWEPSDEAEALKKEYRRAKRRRNRWGGNESTAVVVVTPPTDQERCNAINALLKDLPPHREAERATLTAERNALVKAIVAAKFGDGMGGLKPKPQHVVKFPLPDNTCPGGVGNLIGLIIGPRGKTQQRIQNETGTVLVVRGKGATKTATGMIDDTDEEETHVRITGPNEEVVNKALDMVKLLIDFNSDEGEAMRNAQLRELKILNGTLQEDKDIDYKALFTNPQKAANTGPLGASAGIRAQFALPAPPSSSIAAAATANNEEAEYAKMMAEIGGLTNETDAAGGAPPPAAAPPLPATPTLNPAGYAPSAPGYPPRPGMPGMAMPPQPQMPMYAPQMPMYGGGMPMRPMGYGGPMGYAQPPMPMPYGGQMPMPMQMPMRPQPPQPPLGQLAMPQGFGQLTMPNLPGSSGS